MTADGFSCYNRWKTGRCGTLTLICELLKGFLPVYLYLRGRSPAECPAIFALILAAPVLGHAFSVFYGFHGGKGIAVSFGCLLGLSSTEAAASGVPLIHISPIPGCETRNMDFFAENGMSIQPEMIECKEKK